MKTDNKVVRRQKIRFGIRKKVGGTSQKPRLSVFRSNTDIYVQLIDDASGKTLAAASSKDKD
ncbi:MAG: 50S ribosomal protein L18, partial [Bacteroidota bacterium]